MSRDRGSGDPLWKFGDVPCHYDFVCTQSPDVVALVGDVAHSTAWISVRTRSGDPDFIFVLPEPIDLRMREAATTSTGYGYSSAPSDDLVTKYVNSIPLGTNLLHLLHPVTPH